MKILLISGHGAGDPGASGNGYKEADLTRELVNLIASKLNKCAIVDIYDQKRNAYKDVQVGKFKPGKYEYVLEVHFNAFNGKGHGTEIYVTTREKGITVEQAIMKNMSKFFTLRDNDSIFDGVKRENFSVINKCKNLGMSGALLETCFIDNKADMKVYQDHKNEIAEAIVNGIVAGFGLKKTSGETVSKPAEKPAETTENYYKKFNSTSIVDGLKSIGVNSSYEYRKKIAKANGIANYSGTASQNEELLSLARQGKLKKA
jgi:N-acetylmuramoyl-L-alanine amidase